MEDLGYINYNAIIINKYLVPLHLFLQGEFVDKHIFKIPQMFFHIALQKTCTYPHSHSSPSHIVFNALQMQETAYIFYLTHDVLEKNAIFSYLPFKTTVSPE